jgi:hypothetical protein
MFSSKAIGRLVGGAVLVQTALAPVINFQLVRPATARDFLSGGAASALQVRAGLLLALVAALLAVATALVALPVFRRASERMTFAYLAFAVVGVATAIGEGSAARELLAMSIEYNRSGQSALLETLASVTRSSWVSAHYLNLTMSLATTLLLYAILLRSALVPRWLAAFGIFAAIISMTIGASQLVGMPLPLEPMASIGVANLALILWLLVRGFAPHVRRSSDNSLELATA